MFVERDKCPRKCQNINVQKQIIYTRVALASVGVLTICAGLMVILNAITQLRTWEGDPLSDASIALLFLGALLALGGGCLARRGMKYQGRGNQECAALAQ